MENSLIEVITYYVIIDPLVGGFQRLFPDYIQLALQNLKGHMVGYKDHKTYGDISSYENSPTDNTKFISHLVQTHERSIEKLNGRAAMIGFVAAVGVSGQWSDYSWNLVNDLLIVSENYDRGFIMAPSD